MLYNVVHVLYEYTWYTYNWTGRWFMVLYCGRKLHHLCTAMRVQYSLPLHTELSDIHAWSPRRYNKRYLYNTYVNQLSSITSTWNIYWNEGHTAFWKSRADYTNMTQQCLIILSTSKTCLLKSPPIVHIKQTISVFLLS